MIPGSMLKVMTLIGTRPEAVKMAPLVHAIRRNPALQSIVCATGQHREMLDQVLRIFAIKPDIDLNVMRPNQQLAQTTATILTELDVVLAQHQPDWVLVQGDTTTVMAASLAAYYRRIKIGHVEAGLRTYDKNSPFPEEANRRIADALADLYFAPTEVSRANLLREGVCDDAIVVTGNSVIDALLEIRARVRDLPLSHLTGDLTGKRLILVTSHRRESFGEPFLDICRALRALAERYAQQIQIVYPVHLNPQVREPAHALLGGIPNIVLTAPVDYETIVALMDRSYMILTDSGGIQEEAPSLGKPLLVLREKTERVEVITCGAGKLVGTDYDVILSEAIRLLEDDAAYQAMARAGNPYGDGHASARMVDAIIKASRI
jgi:UDP-N-acetylglucosamine 2-epimerase (non-hydrolysing)